MIDQGRWDDEMPDLIEAYLDHCHHWESGQFYGATVKEKHIILVWSTYGTCHLTAERLGFTDVAFRTFVLRNPCI